jgi:hypothetical protein
MRHALMWRESWHHSGRHFVTFAATIAVLLLIFG